MIQSSVIWWTKCWWGFHDLGSAPWSLTVMLDKPHSLTVLSSLSLHCFNHSEQPLIINLCLCSTDEGPTLKLFVGFHVEWVTTRLSKRSSSRFWCQTPFYNPKSRWTEFFHSSESPNSLFLSKISCRRSWGKSVWHFIYIQKIWLCNPCPAEAALPGLHLCPRSFHMWKNPFVHPRAATWNVLCSHLQKWHSPMCFMPWSPFITLICNLLSRKMFCCSWLRVKLMTPERILCSVNSQKCRLAKQRDKAGKLCPDCWGGV